jgi:hypothetical protein
VADVGRIRFFYTALLLATGVGSVVLVGSMWPLGLAAAAAGIGWFAASPRRLRSGADREAESSAALLARLGGELRRRHLEVERTADEIRGLLSRPGRDAELWRPESRRVEDLVDAHLHIAARIEEDADVSGDADALNARLKDLKLRSPRPEVAREVEAVEQRLELARARDARLQERDAHLREIESALELVRDRLAATGDDHDVGAAIASLVAGAEAAAAAEREAGRLAIGARAQSAGEGGGKP